MKPLVSRWYPLLIALAAALLSLLLYPRLPAGIVTHWDAGGSPDGWMPRAAGAFVIPALILLLGGVLRIAPRLDPRREHYARFARAYETTIAAVLLLLFVVHILLLAAGLGYHPPMARLGPVLAGVVFVVIGNVMPQARSNWVYGIRTPWTLSNERVWQRTHRVGGTAMTAAGIFTIVAGLLVPPQWGVNLIVGSALTATVGPAVYSYFVWKQEENR